MQKFNGIHLRPFAERIWGELSIDTQISILQSLQDLDNAGLKHSHKPKFYAEVYGQWRGFAEHMIPRMVERLFIPGKDSAEQQKHRKVFLHILAADSYYARLIEKSGLYGYLFTEKINDNMQERFSHSIGLKYSTLIVNTLLNDKNLAAELFTAASELNTTFMLQLLKLRYEKGIESSYFEKAMIDSWKVLLTNSEYEPAAVAESIKNILDYLYSFYFKGVETGLLDQFRGCITQHCTQDRRIADCFNYRGYGIKLPGDPEKTFWLPKFDNLGAKTFIGGTAATVVSAAVLLKASPGPNFA